MDAILANAHAEHVAGTLTDERLLHYLDRILTHRGYRSLNVHGTRFADRAVVAPGHNDAIIVLERDVIAQLATTLEVRETFFGWPRPAIHIRLQLDGVRRARCLVGVLGRYGQQTLRARTLQVRRHALNAWKRGARRILRAFSWLDVVEFRVPIHSLSKLN
ncbi:hypothetical protein C8R46DRAFT_1351581 [Mycena filopes]|nr:hypothetical protein C8R46DRAFT_1351581 [Mycena filopes]